MNSKSLFYNVYIFSIVCVLTVTSCSTPKLSTAIEQYNNGEYFEASKNLKKIYAKTDAKSERVLKGEIAWYMANCFDKLMIPSQASANYINANRYGYADSSILLKIAQSKHKEGLYKEAIKYYNEYLEVNPEDNEAIKGLKGAKEGLESRNNLSRYEVKRFPLVNSRRADFSPAVYGSKDDELYYTTSNDKVTGTELSNITGSKYCDIWVTQKDEKGNWSKPKSISDQFNTTGDEGTPCFSPDGSTMYYTVSMGEQGSQPSIYYSKRSDATWSKGSKLNISNDTLAIFAHPAISLDGKYLYFVSNMPGGQGGLDIWRASLNGESVGYFENLGDKVNSKGDEMFPTISNEGLLYYSSNGFEGYGGLDIYCARLDDWNIWHVEHLGAPINSSADDFGMTFMKETKEQQEGWFSSNRNSGKGYDNIYSFKLPSINVRITGTVYDTEGYPISEAIVRVVGRNGMNFKSITKPDGTYEVNIDCSTEYVMMSGKSGYLNRKAQFTSESEEEDADYEVDFCLPSIDVPVVVDNVFYAYNEASITEESYPSLDDLVALLNENPYTQIELSAHTDRIGSDLFNNDLSLRRAESVCQYLIDQGISADRLVPVGYGKTQPVVVDENIAKQYGFEIGQTLNEEYIETLSDEEKKYADQINRRTEFKVLSTTWGIK